MEKERGKKGGGGASLIWHLFLMRIKGVIEEQKNQNDNLFGFLGFLLTICLVFWDFVDNFFGFLGFWSWMYACPSDPVLEKKKKSFSNKQVVILHASKYASFMKRIMYLVT